MAVTINGTTGIETNTDTGRVKVGADDDLEMYHDGSYSKIKTGGSSHLFIQADYDTNQWLYLDAGHTIELRTTGYETAVKCNPNGSVDLYHNNTKQCETSANGLAFPSGKGIDFSATSDVAGMTSELLDDYEVGTFTPVLENDGSTTYTTQTGRYVKIGSLVHVDAFIQINNEDGSSALVTGIENMPFSNGSGMTVTFPIAGNGGWDANMTSTNFIGWFPNGTTTARFYKNNGGNLNPTPVDDIGSSGEVSVTITYRAA